MNLKIDWLKYQKSLKLSKKDGVSYIFDPIRKKKIILTPEEHVRQLIILYLTNELKINQNLLSIEKGVKINGLVRRTDIILHSKNLEPELLIECKNPKIKLDEKTILQIANYHSKIDAKLLLITNGIDNYFFGKDSIGKMKQLDVLPNLFTK